MKGLYICMLLLIGFSILVSCQLNQENRMHLLDETIKEINVSESNGTGDINLDIIYSFNDQQAIKIFEHAIKNAVQQKAAVHESKPDYDVMVEYREGFPAHVIHLWLGEEGESSIFMYMVGERETYVTSTKSTIQLRELILSQDEK